VREGGAFKVRRVLTLFFLFFRQKVEKLVKWGPHLLLLFTCCEKKLRTCLPKDWESVSDPL